MKGVKFLAQTVTFMFIIAFTQAMVSTHPSIQWVPGPISSGAMEVKREVRYSPNPRATIKSLWD
jgi:hypothetical protein